MKPRLVTVRVTRCIVSFCAAAVLALVLGGCATVVRGTTQKVRVESVPSGATVVLSNGMRGVTPVTFTLERKHKVTVHFDKTGYLGRVALISPVDSNKGLLVSAVGNSIAGGVIGSVIDQSNHAHMDLYPNPLKVILREARGTETTRDWAALSVGLPRREVRYILGEPSSISDDSSSQVWTYSDGGVVHFKSFFVAEWHAPVSTGDPDDELLNR